MATAKKARVEAEPYEESKVLHVGQLPAHNTLDPIRDALCDDCLLIEAGLNHEPGSREFGKTYGHVDIHFFSVEGAQAACKKLSGRVVEGRILTVQLGSPLPTTKKLREIVDEEPTEDHYFVIGETDEGKQAFVVHQVNFEGVASKEDHLVRHLLHKERECYFVGELNARLRACLACMKWKDLLLVDLRE